MTMLFMNNLRNYRNDAHAFYAISTGEIGRPRPFVEEFPILAGRETG